MVTMRDIAREAGLSRTTVSLVLNGLEGTVGIQGSTKAKVLAVAEELGYRPNELARSMIKGRSNFIACVVSDLAMEYESRPLAGVVGEAERQGFFVKLVFTSSREDFAGAARRIVGQRPAGVFLLGLNDPEFPVAVQEFHRHGIPFATAGASPARPVGIRVCPDNVDGAAQAAEHLLGLGHRDIAFASGDLVTAYAIQRRQGFMDALLRRQVDFQGRNAVCNSYTDRFEMELERLFASSPRPSAIFCAGDPGAMQAARAARKAGLRVPEDLSVVGYADLWAAAYYDPPLTTVAEPFEELGRVACAMLLEEVGRERRVSFSEELFRQLPVKLVVRKSTARF